MTFVVEYLSAVVYTLALCTKSEHGKWQKSIGYYLQLIYLYPKVDPKFVIILVETIKISMG